MDRANICRLWSVFALLCALACASSNSPGTGPMEIELDAFSGRRNHRWTASPDRAASVSRALAALPAATDRGEPDHLGYRGFIVRQQGLYARVYDGHVIVTANGTTRTFLDSVGLEEQLITDARERGFGDVISK
jgi:hypothetical protein